MTSIGSLPVEIVLQIIRLAIEPGPEAVGVCAAVSRQWQQHVERQSFALIRLNADRASEAKEILTPARQTYVRHINMEALLPEYDDSKLFGCRETDEEQQQNNRAFTRAIIALFDCLSRWDSVATGTGQPSVTLELCAFSPSDTISAMASYRAQRWKHSFLSLENGVKDELPALGMITSFVDRSHVVSAIPRPRHRQYFRRYIAASVFGVIASKMPNLEQVDWALNDDENENVLLRQKLRQEFATSLMDLPRSVRHFRLFYPNPGPKNDDFQPPRAYRNGLVSDPLSIALYGISQECVTFILDGTVVFDTNIFWPHSLPSNPDKTPFWSRLEEFNIRSSRVSPSGAWLFHADPSAPRRPAPSPRFHANSPEVLSGDDPTFFYKVHLDHEYFRELCLAAARAAARMPRLKLMMAEWDLGIACQFGYRVYGEGTCAEYWSESTPAFPLTAETEDAWRAAARVHIGESSKINFDLVDLGEKHPMIYG
ncbi:hypothetical protein JX265_005264 [Neoarthrinium moseri]|uniref:DUF6546 domain-containing protein n=1 Tax=Neoarthrinium moseri TaxID=1658444 RepID=A0A9Q0AQK8_9PEZI|nr:hypothetical protein JX266_008498 [Neoarthrinium moseri]KAI1873642.1 hypothetical protein JX265_005264 [Neoarthrinium moseri]